MFGLCRLNKQRNSALGLYYLLANEVVKGYSNATVRPSFRNILCEHSRINILQWILTKLGTYLVLKRIWNPIDFQGQRSRSLGQIFCHVTSLWTLRINILQWILTNLGTYWVLRRIWNLLIFKVKGQIFRRGDTPGFALPLFNVRFI